MAAASVSACAALVGTAPATATVLRVVDGDTVDVLDDARGRLRVRVLGIDTPGDKAAGLHPSMLGPRGHRIRDLDAAEPPGRADC